MLRQLSGLDKLIAHADNALRTLTPKAASASRKSPAEDKSCGELSEQERKHIAGLMRVNHTGEVCAQALYQGQALTAKLPTIREKMEDAAQEETDHLVWCETRVNELGGNTSLLNPLFYMSSFAIGAAAGAISDELSLGFVEATESQVCKHLQEHTEQVPEHDKKTHAILEQMLIDEREHGDLALEAGGKEFPAPVKLAMTSLSKLMTKTTYRI